MYRIMNNKGITIPLVLIVLLVTMIFGFTSIFIMNSQSNSNVIDDANKKAIEYAEAGYNAYLWHLNDDVNFYSHPTSDEMQNKDIIFQDGYYRLEVTKPSDMDRFITIKSTGWTTDNPTIKRTILAKIRKKQFVHHVYVSDNEGSNIWWTTGDESHGPYHTNGDLKIQQRPIFYDTVTYSKSLTKGTGYNPDFKVKDPVQPQKIDILAFPATNEELINWAAKDGMVFEGRTCIYLDGENIRIRNGSATSAEIITKKISDIKNKVIYVDKKTGGGTGKFDLSSGNIFISGQLKGIITIAAANDIYITYADPTNWYDYDTSNMKNQNIKPLQPPLIFKWKNNTSQSYPETGGIKYKDTTFTASFKPTGKDYWIREASGKDMLGLVANNDIKILHYGWPKMPISSDGNSPYWNFEWTWKSSGSPKNLWVPSSTNSKKYDVAPNSITIDSAIFAVNGGFGYEIYNEGSRKGDITLWGSITQKIRLAVGTIGTTGYDKIYFHDPRMFYDYPPHILEPTNVGWEIHEWKEIKE